MWIEANNWKGGLLGGIMDAGLSMVGGVYKVYLLGKNGRDHAVLKGAFYGTAYGALITALLSGFSSNKVKPKVPQVTFQMLFVLQYTGW